MIFVYCLDGNVSAQKKFVRQEFNFGLQERLTGTDMPVEDNDFKNESMSCNNSNIKCVCENYRLLVCNICFVKVSSSDLQRFVFGEKYRIIEQDHSIEPTPSKRLKSSSTNEENDEVRLKNTKFSILIRNHLDVRLSSREKLI